MSAVTASLYWTLLLVGVLVFVSADQEIVPAESGQDVTLTCRTPNNNIRGVEWRRADLEDEYVLVYRDGQFVRDIHHPSFKNRVDLQDRQMKDGDVSLILNDVTINDTGTYKCRVFMEETRSWEVISIIYLRVDPPGQTGGHTVAGSLLLIIGLIVSTLLVVIFLIYKRKPHDFKTYIDIESTQPIYSPQEDCDSALKWE